MHHVAELPETMRAIALDGHGGSEVLTPTDRPVPHPGPGEVLIAVAAAGINRPDILQRLGRYPPPPGSSDLPGLEVSGRVVARGTGVVWPELGDSVCALLAGGGYAGYATAPAPQCLPVPPGLSWTQAAALPEATFTVWSNLFDRARLGAGEIALIHGGASGIGTTAIQLAKAFGATVYTTVGTAAKARQCEALGAARAIDYRNEDFVQVLSTETQGYGADVILDMVAGDYIRRNLEAAAEDARLVTIGVLGGAKSEINMMKVMLKRVTLTGSTLRARDTAFKGAIAERLHHHVWPLLAAGQVAPVIHSVYSAERAAAAHRALEHGDHVGKFVLSFAETV